MERESYINICQAVEHGASRLVRNTVNGESGSILSCHGDKLQVRVGDQEKTWDCHECEAAPGS